MHDVDLFEHGSAFNFFLCRNSLWMLNALEVLHRQVTVASEAQISP